MSKTLNIGSFDRPVFIFGGVYGNIEALIEVKNIAEKEGFRPKDIICTGDIVAYCANPVECIAFVEEWGIHCIAGNVELNLRDEADDCGCNFNEGSRCDVFSRQWYPYVKNTITKNNKEYIHKLPEFLTFDFYGKPTTVLHGSFHNTSEFVFASTSDEVFVRNFEDSESEIIIAGHCGLPFEKRVKNGFWVNAGVIGMPANDGTARTWCGILGLTQKEEEFTFIEVNYNHNKAADSMKKAGLPLTYASTLISGIWDNCEILPIVETAQQGSRLELARNL